MHVPVSVIKDARRYLYMYYNRGITVPPDEVQKLLYQLDFYLVGEESLRERRLSEQ